MKSKNAKIKKVIFIILAVIFVIAAATAGTYTVSISAYKGLADAHTVELGGADRIHFLNTGSTDCFLIESNGHFALIDCAEDSEFPADRPNLDLQGYEDVVLEYLSEYAADENGGISLDFIAGTHAHSDHIGGFDTLISDERVSVGRAYLKEYRAEYIRDYEIERWDNQEVYDQMVNALSEKGIQLISDIPPEPFVFEDFEIQFFNTEYYDNKDKKIGENENSLGVLVSKEGKKVFLAGDMNNIIGTETAVKEQLGKIDVLKAGHHGYIQSSTWGFIKTLDPETVIVSNSFSRIYPNVLLTYLLASNSKVYATVDCNGIILEIEDGNITIQKNSFARVAAS